MPDSLARKAILLDRDGTLIVDKVYLNDPEKIEYLPKVFDALRSLRDSGFIFVIVTNQSGLSRGLVDIRNLDLIHEKIRAAFAREGVDLLHFYYSPHSPIANHYTRKPNPGMLHWAALDFRIDLSRSWMIGDRATDVEAGIAAGSRTVLLKWPQYDIGESHPQATLTVPGLWEAAYEIRQK